MKGGDRKKHVRRRAFPFSFVPLEEGVAWHNHQKLVFLLLLIFLFTDHRVAWPWPWHAWHARQCCSYRRRMGRYY